MEPLDYEAPKPKQHSFRFLPVGVAILIFLILLSSILIPSNNRPLVTANRVRSASNLRQIGQAILLYTNENGCAYPNDFQTLLMTEDITSEVFVSPLSNDTKAEGPTTRAIADQLMTGGHCSYVYLGSRYNAKTVPDTAVAAYELPLHAHSGGNVLFGDGHVEWFDAKFYAMLAARPAASTQPVVLTSDK